MKAKYRLNPETLTYERIGEVGSFNIKNLLWVIISGIAFGFLFIILVAYIYPTPHERQQQQDLHLLQENYDNLTNKLEQAIVIYEQLLEKDREIHKLTFDAELQNLKSITDEIHLYSPDFNFSSLMKETSSKIQTSAEKSVQLLYKIRLLLEIAYGKKMFVQSIPSVLPLEKGSFVLVSGFGDRIHPIFKALRHHNGIDLAAKQGTSVVATGSGTVISPPSDLDGFGNIVAIDHGFGYVSIYACLLKSEVKRGARVSRGDVIGKVGRSGITTGPHLHYEVRKNGKPLNPVNYFFLSLSPSELYDYMEKASVQNQNMS
jgi:murein DD-endopeptidase MepM/ murein hydrolase activator NlpD